MGRSGGKILNDAGHSHTAHMDPQREHGSKGVISSTTAAAGGLCWDLAGSCGCQSTATPEYLLWGEERRESRVLLWYRACEQKYIPKQLHWGAGEWYFKRCQAGRKSSRCFFHAWKKTGKLFGEMVSNGKSSQKNGGCEGKTEPREEFQSQGLQLLFGQSAGWLNLAVVSCFEKVFFLLVFLFLQFFPNCGGTELISKGIQPGSPTSKGHRKGPACVFPFLLLHLSYTSQSAA